ncbi:MAG: two-component regulator propeller domain-containing protein [Ignavibacteriaceae bacterium]
MKYIVSLFIVLFFTNNLIPQQISNWENYTDKKVTKDLAVTSEGLWVATGGGAYFYNPAINSFDLYSKAQGLNGTSLTAVAIDKDQKIWFGSTDGMIDVFDPSSNSFHSILDIYNSDKTSKTINNITISGDTVYIATDFGISLINAKDYSFYDTFLKFGDFSSNIKINSILVSNLIYVAAESGVAIQKSGSTNLSAPESWNTYTQLNGLPSNIINKLIFYNNSLIAATDKGLSIFDGSVWQNFLSLTNYQIIDVLVDGTSLYILTPAMVYLYDGNATSEVVGLSATPTKLAYLPEIGLYVSTNKGVLINNSFIFPNGPAANQFPNLVVDDNGNLWSSSGTDVSGVGFYTYDGNEWKIYDVQHYPELLQNGYIEVYSSSDNTIYAGNWGQGFVRLKNDKIERFDANNSEMVGIPTDNNFVVVTGFAKDSKDNLWILNYWPGDRNTLSMLTSDSLWYFFTIPAEQNKVLEKHYNLVIDQSGTKWYNSQAAAKSGLFYFNEKGTYNNADDDISGYLSTSNGLNSSTISDIVVDRRGDLWVGTSLGVNIITNLSTVLNSTSQLKISSPFSVRQQTVNAIAVDPLNQKWIGTNEGLFLLSTDGTQLLSTLTSKDSPLLSDKIISIAIDEKDGRVYVGTEAGLTSFDTPSILPVESFNGLNIYPNPLILKDGSQLVTIDGLIKDTDIKIISIAGKLLREFSSPGGRVAFWDGKDDSGNLVGSGIYIVIAFDKEGNSVETGKIAVLRD